MSSPNNRRRRDRGEGGHDDNERWLLTYADMITLLMALFVVLWSVSSVNVSKYTELRQSLHQAFSGKLLPGTPALLTGQPAVLTSPGQVEAGPQLQIAPKPNPTRAIAQSIQQAAARNDLENLRRIQRKVEAYARTHGFAGLLRTSIDERGLAIRLLTDDLLFDTGRAELKSRSLPLLTEISALLASRGMQNPVRVEGNTDSVPIATAEFQSNWELSSARANAVLEFLLAHRVAPRRLSVTGHADQRPLATNTTVAGRATNRRVELVVLRRALTSGGLDG